MLPPVTRLAPSPTGALHLGNARTFLVNWLLARRSGWRIVLRIDDLDGPRTKPGADRQAVDDLRWLGLDWDAGPVYQSARAADHAAALQQLAGADLIYPCTCTRREVGRAAAAPHAEDGSAVYPGTCHDRYSDASAARRETGREPAWRFRVPDVVVKWADAFAGPQSVRAARDIGDFVVAKNDSTGTGFGTPAYQLATVMDDLAAGVTHVVRGDDLIDSTPRQMLLYDALGAAARVPTHYHLPLILGPDGRRLAKRHGDTRLSIYRAAGVPPGRMLALLARWSGVDAGDSVAARDLLEPFDLRRLPRDPVTFTAADETWLRAANDLTETH